MEHTDRTDDLNPDTPSHLSPEVDFKLTPAYDLSHIADNSLDRVFTSNFLEHLPDKAACDTVLKEVRRTLKPGGKYALKQTSKWTRALVKDLHYRLDVNTLHRDEDANSLSLNEIGRVTLRTTAPHASGSTAKSSACGWKRWLVCRSSFATGLGWSRIGSKAISRRAASFPSGTRGNGRCGERLR